MVTMSQIASARIPTAWGDFVTHGFEPTRVLDRVDGCSMVALTLGDQKDRSPILYVASACRLCETFGSVHCGARLSMADVLAAIAAHGAGIVLMPYDEVTTLTAGLLTANKAETEGRMLAWAAGVLSALGVTAFSLLADSRRYAAALLEAGFDVIDSYFPGPESHLPHEDGSLGFVVEEAR